MPRPQPRSDPDPDGCWPSCDDQQPGVSIRPLSHADLAALLAHHDQPERHQDPAGTPGWDAPVPVLARRVRASVGRPGASATASTGAAAPPNALAGPTPCPGGWPRCLAAGVTAGLLASQMAPDLAGLLAMAAAAALGWRLRFRPGADTPGLAAPGPLRGAAPPPPPPPAPGPCPSLGSAARPGRPRHPEPSALS